LQEGDVAGVGGGALADEGIGGEGNEEVWMVEVLGDTSLLNKTDALLDHLYEPYPFAD
jgi:hypothetical protein